MAKAEFSPALKKSVECRGMQTEVSLQVYQTQRQKQMAGRVSRRVSGTNSFTKWIPHQS